jgi:DNA-binding SARP family transcriptional activator
MQRAHTRRDVAFDGSGTVRKSMDGLAVGSEREFRGAAAKVLPPEAPTPTLERPRLFARLDRVLGRRLAVVSADAGYGKTTLLAAWAAHTSCAWYTTGTADRDPIVFAAGLLASIRLRVPGIPFPTGLGEGRGPETFHDEHDRARVLASLVVDALHERLAANLALVVDDLDELADSPSMLLIEHLCREAPPRLHPVLVSRAALPFPVGRLRTRGQVLELTGFDLALDVSETGSLLDAIVGDRGAELAGRVHDLTGGWAAAVVLAGDAIAVLPFEERADAVQRFSAGQPVLDVLAREVLNGLDADARALLHAVAPLDRWTPELAKLLGIGAAHEITRDLRRRGVVGTAPSDPLWYTVQPPVRAALLESLDGSSVRRVHQVAAVWLEERGELLSALLSFEQAGDHAELARLLSTRGNSLLRSGGARDVVRVCDALPSPRAALIAQVEADARYRVGDWDGALRAVAGLEGASGSVSAAAAWRIALVHYLRGELEAAIDCCEAGLADTDADPRERALVLAWRAAVHWVRGEIDVCRNCVREGFELAEPAHDDGALAALHTVLAMLAAIDGDRRANDAHYLRALEHADRAGDVLQTIRIRSNRGSHFLEEAEYPAALTELDEAVRLAELAGFRSFAALALGNRGEVLLRLGRYEEARADLEASKAAEQSVGSRMVSYPLVQLGELRHIRGEHVLAASAFEEAIRLSETVGDLQALVPALAGLAELTAAFDPSQAEELVQRAINAGPVLGHQRALVAAARVALARDDTDTALARAREAQSVSRARRDSAGLAEALLVLADAEPDAHVADNLAIEAEDIGAGASSPLLVARAELVRARRGGGEHARARAESAAATFRRLGARRDLVGAERRLADFDRQRIPSVVIRTLGGFSVLRDDNLVDASAWQSKKARDLLKLLVARRGHPIAREQLRDLLWDGEIPARSASRLSVTLSTLRAALDPGRAHDPDHFVAGDRETIALRLGNVSVDVEQFLRDARGGLDAANDEHARPRLEAAEAAYAGEFLEEDPYADWAVALREEARATYVAVARRLAGLAERRDDADTAARYLRRVLERDAYDESAHLRLAALLAASGRHGEAHRAYRTYCAAMAELEVEPSPYPGAGRAPT